MSTQSDYEAFLAERARLDALLGGPDQAAATFGLPSATAGAGPVGALTNAGGDAIIDSSGITVVNGAIRVENAGATVIIDGTSDMFKIVATGTISAAWPNQLASVGIGGANIAGVTSGGAMLAIVGMVAEDIANPAADRGAPLQIIDAATGTFIRSVSWRASAVGTDIGINVYANAVTSSLWPLSAGMRYYVLKEAGI